MRDVQRNLSETRYTVKGLTNGVTYYFTVAAQDKDDLLTPVSPAPVAVTPMAGDAKPASAAVGTTLQATPGDGEAILTWRVPPGAKSGLDKFRARGPTRGFSSTENSGRFPFHPRSTR